MDMPERRPLPGAGIGAAGAEFEWVVERGKVAEFARACLAGDPAHSGADAVAPPTFPVTATALWEAPGSRPGLPEPFDPRRVLHGEQEFVYERPLRAGDVLTGVTRLADAYERTGRRGGTMRFAVWETTFTDSTGSIVARSRATIIETSKAPER
ncbi:MAG TPA: MaoC family dehydratase N-terminal domain-containing protein [Actinomycetota bacterium]|nr:MaoC family dehydratase N-terminal domain-containing protein [Actinomycetota bacterium]